MGRGLFQSNLEMLAAQGQLKKVTILAPEFYI
jgi:hypothetical protein